MCIRRELPPLTYDTFVSFCASRGIIALMQPHAAEPQVLPGTGSALEEADRLRAENEALRRRLSGLSEASLRIIESLDFDTVLQGVIDSARSLTDARYGALLIFDDSGGIETLITSGMTPEERRRLGDLPRGLGLLQHLNEIEEPLRLADLAGHARSVGFPKGHPPMRTFLGTPVRHLGERVGNIYLTEKEGGLEFTLEDEETLVMFASQAAMAIANAHRYRDERRLRADLQALVDTSPVGIVVVDADTRTVTSINRETERIYGVRPEPGLALETVRARTFLRRLDGSELTPDENPLERALRYGETVRAEEVVVHLRDGRTVTVLMNVTPIRSEDGKIVSAVAVIQDMTPLQELERLRAEFLGMVSHELRTPLTTIKGSAATVLGASSTLSPAEMGEFFRIIDEQADHMRVLISDLLDVTRVETGTLSITPGPTDVADVVDQARSAFLRGGARNSIEVDLPPDLPRVGADAQRIVQVLDNLFSNASKYSPEGSAIGVSASQEDVYVAISVVDEGRGVASEQLTNLFRKFFRLDGDDPHRHVGGEGLGLAICKGIVEAHGGRIWAESAGQGLGTRFTFTIPAVDEAANGPETGPGQLPDDPGRTARGRVRILAVDDEPHMLRLVRNTLSEAGYTPIVTGSPDEVERLIEAEKPHLVLMDMTLPGVDGIELTKRILGIIDVPVIFLSGHDGDQDVARAFEAGADDYIVKPFSPTELVARIEAVLRRQTASDRTKAREPYTLGDLTINYAERLVTVAGRPVQLTATEYKLLFELSINAGRVLTHDHLLRRGWGPDYSDDSRLLRSFLKKLRRKLGDDASSPTYIFTEPRVGYRMAKPGAKGMPSA